MDWAMIIFLMIFSGVIMYRIKLGKNLKNSFVEKSQSIAIKGICCIIVILVHIPSYYGNKLQDAMGSFGYICVTIFFLYSAYGLRYSLNNKKNYLQHFIKNIIIIIYIPFVISNIIYQFLINCSEFDIFMILGIKNITFIGELILFYILFYLVYKNIKNYKKADIIMITLTIAISIVTYIFRLGWYVECLGFAFGIIIFNCISQINKLCEKNYFINIIIFFITSCIFGILYISMKNVQVISYFLRIILGISIISLLIVLLKRIKIYNRILDFLGRISYEVYLLHPIIIELLNNLNVKSGTYILIVIGITVICSYLLNLVDSKIGTKIKNFKYFIKYN